MLRVVCCVSCAMCCSLFAVVRLSIVACCLWVVACRVVSAVCCLVLFVPLCAVLIDV